MAAAVAPAAPPAKKPLHEYPARTVGTTLYTHIGIDSLRRNGLHALDDHILLSAAGNAALFINTTSGIITSFTGPEDGGIGAVCVHPTRRFFVVCEKLPTKPMVYVMEYPSKAVYKKLADGAQRGFSACNFNSDGSMLATVGIEPDFVLTVWNWREQATILRNKAFSADVYSVAFNPFNDGLLVTSGMGHIKFWSMAQTFTGLKLQGAVGKFGRVEISDISAFITLADGKAVSGSENGSLLLWEGNLVKCELARIQPSPDAAVATAESPSASSSNSPSSAGAAPAPATPSNSNAQMARCHEGPVEVMHLIESGRIIMSAGYDGYVRYWSAEQVDAAENTGTDKATAIACLREYYVGDGVKAKCMTASPDGQHWFLLDASGAIRKVPYWGYESIVSPVVSTAPPTASEKMPLMRFNAGGLTAVATSPTDHTCITGGEDGTVRLLNYITKAEHYKVAFAGGAVLGLAFLQQCKNRQQHHGRNFLAVFADGSVRLLQRQRNTFTVLSEFRPHGSTVVAWALDASETQLYTFAHDQTAFYTTIAEDGCKLEPVGYCELSDVPTAADWTASGDRCLVGFKTGNVIALHVPDAAQIDHTVGFKFPAVWEGLGYRQKQKPPEKPKKQHLEGAVDEGLLEEEESSSEEEEDEQDVGPWGVTFIRRLPAPSTGILIGVDAPELCYEFQGTKRYGGNAMGPPPYPSNQPEPEGRVEEPGRNFSFRSTVVTHATISISKKFAVMALTQGKVMVRNLTDLQDVVHAKQLHDGLHGCITGAALSFDDSLILTVALDGMLFAHSLNRKEAPTAVDAANLDHLPIAAVPNPQPISLSIQAQKEHDDLQRQHEAVEGKKQSMLRRIAAVHAQLEGILEENDKAEPGKKCSEDDLVLDHELADQLQALKQRAIESAAQDFVWTSAKKKVLADRLLAQFVGAFEHDAFEVRSFSGSTVTSFRVPKFSARHLERMALIKDLIEGPDGDVQKMSSSPKIASPMSSPRGRSLSPTTGSKAAVASPRDGGLVSLGGSSAPPQALNSQPNNRSFGAESQGLLGSQDRALAASSDAGVDVAVHDDPQIESGAAGAAGSLNASKSVLSGIKSQLEKAEERKRERLRMASQYKDFVTTNPRNLAEDPAELAEIARAERKMGDYVLKSNPEYVIPDHLRPTAERKSRQLILLEHSVHELKMGFNKRLIEMRDVKAQLVASLNKDVERIKAISAQLKLDCHVSPFNLASVEEPEKRFETTREQLEAFEAQRAKLLKRQEALERAKKGFGADLAQAPEDEEEKVTAKPTAAGRRRSLPGGAAGAPLPPANPREKFDAALKERMELLRATELEDEERTLQREALLHERGVLEKRIVKTQRAFDDHLNTLLRAKLHLEAEFTMADMRVILLYREFLLLQDFRKRDNDLAKSLSEKKLQQDDIVVRTRNCAERVSLKVDELSSIQRCLETIKARFYTLMEPVAEALHKPLQRIFLKKIKRLRKNALDGEDDDDDVTSSDEEEEGDDEFADDGEGDVCPNGCDEATYQQVLALRENRLDEEDRAAEVRKAHEQFKKEEKQLLDQATAIDTQLKAVEKEIYQFQNEKQQKLNLLETIVVLKLSQIKCLTPNKRLPARLDTDDIIVFTAAGFQALRRRIADLGVEKSTLKTSLESLMQERGRLLRKKSRRAAELAEWENKAYEVQLLKFGQPVDLEMLETIAVDRETEELKLKLKEEELRWERELARQSERVVQARQEQQQKIAENTALLKDLGSQRSEQHTLEDALRGSTAKIVAKMSGGSKVATAADRAHLKDLVVAQQQEIDALKSEIAMLRRKGGHVYTPVVSKVPAPPQSA